VPASRATPSRANRPGAPLLSALAALAALAWAGTALADYKQTYAKGLEAAADGRWSDVDARMREALAEEATPVAKMKIYGMRFEPYIPQYYIGLAAFRQGNCRVALDNWSNAGTRAIVQGDQKLSGVYASARAECERKMAVVTPPASPPPTAPPTKPVADAPPPVKPPTKPVADAPPPAKPPTKPPTAPPTAPPTRPTTPAVNAPAALASAVDAFLAGRYDPVAGLDVNQFSDTRARYHALMLRAAAKFTQSQLRGEAGQALVAQAQADIRSAKALDAARQPDTALYSPRFRQLFATTR
jgi:hypothetical protein